MTRDEMVNSVRPKKHTTLLRHGRPTRGSNTTGPETRRDLTLTVRRVRSNIPFLSSVLWASGIPRPLSGRTVFISMVPLSTDTCSVLSRTVNSVTGWKSVLGASRSFGPSVKRTTDVVTLFPRKVSTPFVAIVSIEPADRTALQADASLSDVIDPAGTTATICPPDSKYSRAVTRNATAGLRRDRRLGARQGPRSGQGPPRPTCPPSRGWI